MIDLLPCPFCGGKADIDYDGSVYDGTHVYCTECDIRTESYKTKTGSTWDVDAAIAAWNRRALPAAQPDPREAALRDIARQKKTDEMDTEYDVEYADFEGGYNAIIDVARVALRAVQPAPDPEPPKPHPKPDHDDDDDDHGDDRDDDDDDDDHDDDKRDDDGEHDDDD